LAALGDDASIETAPPGYVLRAAPGAVDAGRFEALAATGRDHLSSQRWQEAADDLRAALGLWRGAPFEELGPVGRAEAVRLGELRLTAIEDCCDADLNLGRHRQLVGELETLVHEHPLRERFWGQLMIALYRSRRQAEALRAYQRARAALIEELGIEPGPALRLLDEAILHQDLDLEVAAPMWTGGGPPQYPSARAWLVQAAGRTTPFVGREAELGYLSAAWDLARVGSRQVVLVSGEPGIGKTSLALEFAGKVSREGGTVMFGRCDDEMLVPYQPFAEGLSQRSDGSQQELVVPQLHSLAGHDARTDPDTRLRLFQAVTALLSAAAAEGPVLLVLDDIHWATKATLLMLRHVVQHTAPAALFILGTFRDTEVADALPRAIADLWRNDGVSRLPLAGLTEADVVALVGTSPAGDDGASTHAAAIWSETSGNPFFVNEMIRQLATNGVGGAGSRVPASVREVIAQRVGRLPDAARKALDVAAVIGRRFSLDVLVPAGDMSVVAAIEAMEAATAARLVDEDPEAIDHYRFVHALVSEALLGQLSGSRRARLHLRAAMALEAVDTTAPVAPALIARHYAEAGPAGDVHKAVHYLRLAGDQAMTQLAYEDAVGHVERALSLLESAADRSNLDRCRLLLALGDALGKAGDPLREQEAFLDAARTARDNGHADELVSAAQGLARALSWGGPAQGQAFAFIEEALSVLGKTDSAAHAQLLGRKARCMFLSGAAHQRAVISTSAVQMARRNGDPTVLGPVLNDWHWAAMGPDHIEARLAVADELVVLSSQLNSRELAASAHPWRLCDLLEAGDVDGAAEAAPRLAAMSVEERRPVTSYDVMRATWEGRFADAETLVQDMGRQRLNMGEFDTNEGSVLVMRWLQGRFAEMETVVEPSAAAAPFAFLGCLGLLFVEQGRDDEARNLIDTLMRDGFADVPRNIFWYPQLACFATVCAALAHETGAACLYKLLTPFASRNCVAGLYAFAGNVAHWLGVLATTTGDVQAATAQYEVALARYKRMGARPWWALAANSYGEALRRAGRRADRARADELLAGARSIAAELGMTIRAGHAPSPSSPPT